MKIVIDINNDTEELLNSEDITERLLAIDNLIRAFKDGTVLSKGQGDLISREALKEALGKSTVTIIGYGKAVFLDKAYKIIDNAPTVEYTFEEAFQKTVCENRLYCPARPQGEWIDERNDGGCCLAICSKCRTLEITGRYCRTCGSNNTKSFLKSFNCGADMRGEEE